MFWALDKRLINLRFTLRIFQQPLQHRGDDRETDRTFQRSQPGAHLKSGSHRSRPATKRLTAHIGPSHSQKAEHIIFLRSLLSVSTLRRILTFSVFLRDLCGKAMHGLPHPSHSFVKGGTRLGMVQINIGTRNFHA